MHSQIKYGSTNNIGFHPYSRLVTSAIPSTVNPKSVIIPQEKASQCKPKNNGFQITLRITLNGNSIGNSVSLGFRYTLLFKQLWNIFL